MRGRYRGRHRQVAHHPRLRAALTVAAVTASALVAPLAVSGPAASQATVPTSAFDTLANHPGWLRSATDPAVAAQIDSLKAAFTERRMPFDPATIAAYRVPTVEGFVTYVTAKPYLMTVRPNPNLIYHTPEGDTPVSPRDVLARLLEPSTEPQAGVGGGGGGVGIPPVHMMTTLFDTVWGTVDDTLGTDFNALVQQGIDTAGQLLDDTRPLVTQVLLLVDAVQAEAQRQAAQIIASTGPLADQAVLTATAWLAEAQRIANQAIADSGPLVDQTVVTVTALVAEAIRQAGAAVDSTGSLRDQVMLTIDSWRATAEEEANAAVQTALATLNDLDPERDAANVFNIVPIAVGSLPVNTGTSATTPLAQPVAEPVDAGAALVPQADALYGEADEDDPGWNRNNDDCFLSDNNAWFRRSCWTIDNQINDNSSDVTYWQFQVTAQTYAKQKRGLLHAWVEGVPMQDYAHQQFDGTLPQPDQEVGGDSGCASGTQSLSLSGGKPVQAGYSYSYSLTTCETYTPRPYSDEGHYSNKWHFNPDRDSDGVGYGDSDIHLRNVGFSMGVKTNATDAKVGWTMPTGTEVTKKYCC